MINLFNKIKLLFSYGPELDALLKSIKEQKEKELWESRYHNLDLCYKHRQEQNYSHFSEKNCDHCNLLKRNEKLMAALSKIGGNVDD